MTRLPRDKAPDSTLALLSDSYRFISKRCRRYGSDIFETRLMLRKAVCMQGAEAAEVFYGVDRLTRQGAVPRTALMLLQDKGSVQVLDGEAHRARKRMLMSLMTPAGIRRLADMTADRWRARIGLWEGRDKVVLLDEAREILCRAVCEWAGVPLADADAARRTREFGAMIDGAGAVGPRNWRGLLLRARTERWARKIIEQIRDGRREAAPGSAVQVIAWHREPDGTLLDVKAAVVELLNILRPTVAVAQYVTFAALALHDHPEHRRKIEAGDEDDLELFVQEVRRFYPFFPAVGGRVLTPFDWRGHHFAEGDWVVLDLYGTCHDTRSWDEPGTFRPERFRNWSGSAFDFIPQGGGNHDDGHRCAGEWITIELIKVAVRLLATAMRYDVPEQDLRIDMSRLPAKPNSGFVIGNVRRTG